MESVAFADLEDVFAFAHRRALEGGGRSARSFTNNIGSSNAAAAAAAAAASSGGVKQPTAASVYQLPLPEVSSGTRI